MTKNETHAMAKNKFGGFIPNSCTKLIIGTFHPTRKDKESEFFYYSSPLNRFWHTVEQTQIAKNENLKLRNVKSNMGINIIENQKIFSTSNNIGFIDIFSKIRRKNNSSKDIDIIPQETIFDTNNFLAILDNFKIKEVFTVYKLAYNTLKNCLFAFPDFKVTLIKVDKNEDVRPAFDEYLEVSYKMQKFKVIPLYAATRSRDKTEVKVAQYEKFLF